MHEITSLLKHLINDGLISEFIGEEVTATAIKLNKSIISCLVQNNFITSQQLFNYCQSKFSFPSLELNDILSMNINVDIVDFKLMQLHHILPIKKEEDLIWLGTSDPTNQSIFDFIQFQTGCKVQPILLAENTISKFLEKYISTSPLTQTITKTNLDPSTENDTSLIEYTDSILSKAIQQNASDIHIELLENNAIIRFRQDGILFKKCELDKNIATRITSRLKILARLDISERRLPQDGRFQFKEIDFRISTCPTLFGEKTVLRLLYANKTLLALENLGFFEKQKDLFLTKIQQPQGLILVCGPTGSGKTITLYSALQYLNTIEKNISTVEDPIEIHLSGINQVNIDPKINLSFAKLLRTLLRQDPDIIMVGEIRDRETAEIAIQAAYTGHLVFSTIHTNSAIECLNRLVAMGIPEFHLGAISLIVSQRLIRKLCNQCKKLQETPTNENKLLCYDAEGCHECMQGYKGRTAIYDLLADPYKNSKRSLKKISCKLNLNAFKKIAEGITSYNEVKRVIM